MNLLYLSMQVVGCALTLACMCCENMGRPGPPPSIEIKCTPLVFTVHAPCAFCAVVYPILKHFGYFIVIIIKCLFGFGRMNAASTDDAPKGSAGTHCIVYVFSFISWYLLETGYTCGSSSLTLTTFQCTEAKECEG